MRYCLSCRHLTADTPICTHCGRSFGGSLCSNKKCRALNPPLSRVCGKCGATSLLDSTSSVSFSGLFRLLLLAGVGLLLLRAGPQLPVWGGNLFYRATGLHNPFIWLIETLARPLIFLLCLCFISSFFPGEAGKVFRAFVFNLVNQAVKFAFGLAHKVVVGLGRIALKWILGAKEGTKN